MSLENSYAKRWYGLGVLSLVLAIISIDNSVLDVALPAISNSLGASAKDLQWLMDVYILVFTSLLLTFGAISDKFGRKFILQLGVIIFGLASFGAARSASMEELIFYRAITGLGAAMMMPSTLSIIADMFRDKQERQKAIAIWGMTFGIGFTIGPLLGGWLVDEFGWEAVFYINIPVVIISFVLGHNWLPESKDMLTPKADFVGMTLSSLALLLIVYGIIEAGLFGWMHISVLAYIASGVLFMTLFLLYENRVTHPMLPLQLFKNPSFSVASITLTLAMFGMMGAMFFFSQFFQTIQHYTALQTGLLLIPITVGIFLSSALAPASTQKFGMKLTVAVGIAIAAFALGLFAFILEPTTSTMLIMLGFFLVGFGFGLAMMPATDSIMGAIPEEKLGVGSAMNDTTRELGGALSIAILGSVVNNDYIQSIRESDLPQEFKESVASSIQSAHTVAQTSMQELIIPLADKAFISGLTHALYVGAIITALAALLCYKYLPDEIQKSS
jgi:MFS transporter, DHA2 family, multidrug resistance protein